MASYNEPKLFTWDGREVRLLEPNEPPPPDSEAVITDRGLAVYVDEPNDDDSGG